MMMMINDVEFDDDNEFGNEFDDCIDTIGC